MKEIKSSLHEKSKTGDFIEVCQDMNIASTLPEYIKPKNVGLMFFSMEPDKFFPYTQIDVVQFPSGLDGDDGIFTKSYHRVILIIKKDKNYIIDSTEDKVVNIEKRNIEQKYPLTYYFK